MPRGSGRRPKPTAIRQLEGNPGKRPINANEPRPDPGEPEPPCELSATARSYWRYLVPQLLELKVLTRVDGSALAGCCMAFAEMLDAQKQAYRSVKDVQLRERLMSRADRAAKRWKSFLVEFGMTPASRSRLSTADPGADKQKDPADAFFTGAAAGSGNQLQ